MHTKLFYPGSPQAEGRVPPDPAMADRLRRARESAGYMRAVDAIQAFGQASGSEGRSKVAHLWSLYAQAKKKQTAGSAAPAH